MGILISSMVGFRSAAGCRGFQVSGVFCDPSRCCGFTAYRVWFRALGFRGLEFIGFMGFRGFGFIWVWGLYRV